MQMTAVSTARVLRGDVVTGFRSSSPENVTARSGAWTPRSAGTCLIMTSDARIKSDKDAKPEENAPTDPPIYSEAPTPEEVEESEKADEN